MTGARWAWGVLGLACIAGAPPQAPALREITVTVPVIVTTDTGEVVTNLTRDDFTIDADGRRREIASFSKGDAPLALALLIDRSASMQVPDLEAAITKPFIQSVKSADRVRIGTFADRVILTGPSPGTRHDVHALVDAAFAPLGTDPSPIWDAVDEAVAALSSEPLRRAIILVTDGKSTANVRSLEEVVQHAVVEQVSVTVVDEGTQMQIRQVGPTVARVHPEAALEWMALTTGGLYLPDGPARSSARGQQVEERGRKVEKREPQPLLANAVAALHAPCLIGLSVPADGKFHSLAISVTRPLLTVSAPTIYLAR